MDNEKKELTQEDVERMMEEDFMRAFAETSISTKAGDYSTQAKKYEMNQILNALANPTKLTSAKLLQEVSMWLYYNNGQYQRLIDNYANMNTYDCYLYPTASNKYSKKKNQKKSTEELLFQDYMTLAEHIEKLNHKYNFGWISRRLLIQNEVFLYKVEDSKGVIYVEIPSNMCKICKIINNNLYKYAINMQELSAEAKRLSLPLPIQDLYEKHSNGSFGEEMYIDNGWLIVEDKNALALSLSDVVTSKSIPKLSYIFPSVMRIMNQEENEIAEDKTDNLKIIHMKVPMDIEGRWLVKAKNVISYHNAAKANLPRGVIYSSLCL